MRGYPKIKQIDGVDYVPRKAYDRLRSHVAGLTRGAEKAARVNARLRQQIEALTKGDSDA